nr:lysophospholipase [Polyangiaceae bacterium]
LAGLVILAGNTRPQEDLILEQLTYFTTLYPEKTELRQKVEEARAFKERIASPQLRPEDDPRPPVGGGMTGAYFLFRRGYDPVATVRKLQLPTFILQGERDYQVTLKDLEGWKKGLAGLADVAIKTYPGLNHLFVRGTGTPRPEEYEAPGHVEESVVVDVATWIAGAPLRK